MNLKQFNYGKYSYEYKLIKSDRKTLSLTVYPDTSIILRSPENADIIRREQFLKRKWLWLETQLRFFKKYHRKVYKKEYLSGESFFYLGRQYKLKVVREKEEKVILTKGILRLSTKYLTTNKKHNQLLLENWYQKRMDIIFNKRYLFVLKKFKLDFKPKLAIRKMSKRWGSFLSNKMIILNPKLIHASSDCIDYVITHELCHMRYKKHSKDFYKLLEQKYPKWEFIKEKLEMKFG